MFKSIFLTFLAITMALSASAASFVRTHEDFVHLSDYEKNQLIIKTMELVVELESQYSHEVKKYGYSSERYEKFKKAVSKIQSILFIDSAYAGPGKRPMSDWNAYGNAFKTLMNKDRQNCIFAGWPSKPYQLPGSSKTYCAHPDFIQGDGPNRHTAKPMTEWTQNYPDPKSGSGCGANDRKMIQCNPALFGFKNAANSDLFCVKASDGAHNSAYNCMQEALKERPAGGPIDQPASRLAFLRSALDTNKEAFAGLQEFVYKTCVCDDKAPKNFNRNYQDYIRPHRTCYGMIEMMAAVSCGSSLPIDTSVFQSLRDYAKDKIIYNSEGGTSNTSETMVDHHYKMFLQNEVQNKAKDEYNFLCKNIPKPVVVAKEYACSKAACVTNPPAEGAAVPTVTCTYDVHTKDKADEKATFSKEPTELPAVGSVDPSIAITGEIENRPVSLTCPLELAPISVVVAEKEYVCSAAACKTDPPAEGATDPVISCTYDVHVKDKADEKATFSKPPTELPAAGATGALAINGEIDSKPVSLSCPMTLTPLPSVDDVVAKEWVCAKAECSPNTAPAPAVVAGLAGADPVEAPKAFTCTYEVHEKDKPESKPTYSKAPTEIPAAGATGNLAINPEIDSKVVALSCPLTMKTPAPVVAPVVDPVRGGGGGYNPGNATPRQQIRGSSDTSAVGIK